MDAKSKKYVPGKIVALIFGFILVAIAPHILNIIFPDNSVFQLLVTRPYWFFYLISIAIIGIFIEKKITTKRCDDISNNTE